VEEFDDDAAVAWLTRLAGGDHAALDQACAACLARTDVDLDIRGRAIGLLARVRDGSSRSGLAADPVAVAVKAVRVGRQHPEVRERDLGAV
jgi:hypothetical protein